MHMYPLGFVLTRLLALILTWNQAILEDSTPNLNFFAECAVALLMLVLHFCLKFFTTYDRSILT